MRLSRSERKKFRVKNKIKKVAKIDRFRLCVSRSTRNFSAQIIDDQKQLTLVSASSFEKELTKKGNKKDLSNSIAEVLAKRALEKKITKVYFDRGKYKYHGRIKSFAEILRKNGLIF